MKRNEQVILFEIQQNRILNWKKWCRLLSTTYETEIKKSLAEEKVEQEMFISFELNGKTYGLAFMEGQCLPANSNREVNKIHHKKVSECLKRVSQANVLYNTKIDPVEMYSNHGF